MTIRILCGNRELDDDRAAESAVRLALRVLYWSLPAGTRILVGDARGPDTWAREMARVTPHLTAEVYGLSGLIWRVTPEGDTPVGPWAPPAVVAAQRPDKLPLLRDEMMVRAAALQRDPDTACLAFVRSALRRSGSLTTLGCALRNGFRGQEFVVGLPPPSG